MNNFESVGISEEEQKMKGLDFQTILEHCKCLIKLATTVRDESLEKLNEKIDVDHMIKRDIMECYNKIIRSIFVDILSRNFPSDSIMIELEIEDKRKQTIHYDSNINRDDNGNRFPKSKLIKF